MRQPQIVRGKKYARMKLGEDASNAECYHFLNSDTFPVIRVGRSIYVAVEAADRALGITPTDIAATEPTRPVVLAEHRSVA